MYETIWPDKQNMFLYKKKEDARIRNQSSNVLILKYAGVLDYTNSGAAGLVN